MSALSESLASVSLGDVPLAQSLSRVTEIARSAIPHTEATSITLMRGNDPFTVSYSGQLASDADELQYQRGYGPCMDAARAGLTLVVHDMSTDDRWPDYARQAAERGALSSLSVPLPFQGATIGGLNNYATTRKAFSDEDVAVAEEVAAFVAIAVANADAMARAVDTAEQMRTAMASRAVIEQAKGVLMERHKVTPEDAFTMLTHASQRTNTKLRTIAETLVFTGQLP
ncbi:GAF and ANTAR domain-containing protein [Modestobacter sp. Leaf380]|uniref:GAF and ANTAR domain-containing protein n=1 Tax=Modestobacter sp. Leaf380 TaxID=1736356 RepID=UPI0006F74833|nr:GAF and ANTAR domain-containing protein [Modestobacter sp. Leaf380]KQS65855.1 antitermination regulator [Modestobacter sp. Leaf380]